MIILQYFRKICFHVIWFEIYNVCKTHLMPFKRTARPRDRQPLENDVQGSSRITGAEIGEKDRPNRYANQLEETIRNLLYWSAASYIVGRRLLVSSSSSNS